jgi:hypothetical protein
MAKKKKSTRSSRPSREDRLIHKLTPERAARVLGRPLEKILARRKALRLAVLRPADDMWTPRADEVVRILSVEMAADKLRMPMAAIRKRRKELGLK